ncbi:hypothetical protein BDQ94DRAFT_142314 [Aspergillus welwitschiae]|uniref:Uncharacterized protein n=1 Tax=Aspergillus welwitschiae TaxID=1341132 RepID=A0A3F3Q4U0_9EURO|nr:hypothetical protein BDQ94DRAFT_142314 [Aspergillus welwitschiae]RDH34223.1 hypothetical protein BDQ94DRAFT_142314 [Aspergillus welwitschiae]
MAMNSGDFPITNHPSCQPCVLGTAVSSTQRTLQLQLQYPGSHRSSSRRMRCKWRSHSLVC